jgi:endoglucanase
MNCFNEQKQIQPNHLFVIKLSFMKTIAFLFLSLVLFGCSQSIGKIDTKVNESIRVNQIGYFPDSPKIAIIPGETEEGIFKVLDVKTQKVVFEGNLSASVTSKVSDKTARKADFSEFTKPGEYCVHVPGMGCSAPFVIGDGIFDDLGKASLKAFYFQRASTELPEDFAGMWNRPAGHPDDKVMVHASAASVGRPEGTILASPKGWYDAGDYNKYIVNSGITMGTLMALYEDFKIHAKNLDLNIPESKNQIPDLLDEILWNLQWMATMQDPKDGGVYHKLTTAKFEGMVLPHMATNQRYVVAKGTAATLDFAAVMAQASRVFKEYYPDLSIEFLKSAELAWKWAMANPEVYYRQNELNKTFKPEVVTGAYGDNSLKDEWIWAAAELYISTHNLAYQSYISIPQSFDLPSWNKVSWLGYYSLLRHRDHIPGLPDELIAVSKEILIKQANTFVESMNTSYYASVIGQNERDFVWGSNAVASNQGIALIQAYFITKEEIFLDAALSNLDYIMGKNATGYSFVTGFGYKTPKHPHHRLAEAEPEKEPLPGFLVGGPNPGQQDNCNYPSKIADESYTDEACSYASNEIAINWNAPFAYLVNALEVLKKDWER